MTTFYLGMPIYIMLAVSMTGGCCGVARQNGRSMTIPYGTRPQVISMTFESHGR